MKLHVDLLLDILIHFIAMNIPFLRVHGRYHCKLLLAVHLAHGHHATCSALLTIPALTTIGQASTKASATDGRAMASEPGTGLIPRSVSSRTTCHL